MTGDDKPPVANLGALASILASLTQGVTGINNLTQTLKTIFPSSS